VKVDEQPLVQCSRIHGRKMSKVHHEALQFHEIVSVLELVLPLMPEMSKDLP